VNFFALLESFHGSPIVYAIIFALAFLESLVVIGLVFPGTTLMVFAGYLVSTGKLNFFEVVLLLSLGGISGDILSFYLGRGGKKYLKFVHKFIKPEQLFKAETFFRKYGVSGVIAHRFIGPLRPLLPFAAGLLKMHRRVFIPVDILSNIASALFYVAIGVFVGHRWKIFLGLLVRYEKAALLVLFFLFASYLLLSLKNTKK
jgi:membrane protein DedA with SNARE-associated domain